jgi:hypothetical protein
MSFVRLRRFFSRLKEKASVTIQMADPLTDLLRLCVRITHMAHSKERFQLVKSINVMLDKFPDELHGNPVANQAMLAVILVISDDM